ncbi:hypothetical protein CFC21_070857 [Triticum aestivum]|uniref:Uncharacterized protein n=2 Tax=Triticum aestivum TaxID=4565 RepID=A0A3B6LJ90_WHEAT|nr:uncharacterized protein LOC119308313 isoform X1 [Triticum dicoccoides]XP_037440316.1 uncharacterized protein LOC119308313 isoform X1 [Triticum dicoccoides]XP_044387892.1 uncharacterized protein LOC123111216 isoform X1 [Triticum aestivum]XP_044387893.1 uncharacterized protein LOC123111216 isoform X1 [Triticum aestivum]KAF7064572.1 hypothetical protein CFC21_070857 [Triticum aestivum]
MDSSRDRLLALAEEYPEYDMELLGHVLDNENLRVKYIPEAIKVLFETPSGFAIFAIDSGYLYDNDRDFTGIDTIWVHCVKKESADFFLWPKGFLKLDKATKAIAINSDGIHKSLAEFIEQKVGMEDILLVGESAYVEVIEAHVGVTCRCDANAIELMWGLQNLLHDLVPEEESEFGKNDRKYYSQKLLAYLRHIDNEVRPEMINGEIALLASIIHRCNVTNKNYRDNMHKLDKVLYKRSGLRTDQWDTVTHATALAKLIGESVPIPESMFSSVEKGTLTSNLVDYSDEIDKDTIKVIYEHVVQLNKLKFSTLHKLKILLCDAKAAVLREPRESEEMLVEVPQVFSSKRSCQEEAECDRQNKSLKVNDGDSDVVQSDAIMDAKTN